MPRPTRKQTLTPPNPLIDAASRAGGEPLLCTQGVAGSNPVVSTNRNPYPDCILALPPAQLRHLQRARQPNRTQEDRRTRAGSSPASPYHPGPREPAAGVG
jgi:hypothetical protein